MLTIITIFIFLLVIALSINTVKATENYNSAKSNTVTSVFTEEGLDELTAGDLLKKFETSNNIIHIDEDLLTEELRNIGISEDGTQRILSGLRENAAQELASKLPKAGLTPSSPFYFLERGIDWIGEFFTFSPQAKARLQAEQALERLAEVQAMLAGKEVDPRGIDIALARLENNLQKASRIVEKEKNKGRDVSALAKELDAGFGTQKLFLGSMNTKATGKIKDTFPSLTKTLDIFDQADEKFEQAMFIKLGDFPGQEKVARPEVEEEKEEKKPGLPVSEKPSVPVTKKELLPAAPLPEEQPTAVQKAREAAREADSSQEGAVSAARGKDYNSSVSNTFTVGKIREEVGNILLRYGKGGAEINRVTDALERGIDENELKNLLSEIGVIQSGINETLLKLDEMGAAFPSR